VDPDVASVRSKEFMSELIRVAKERHSPVELAGSVLSHAYYMLTSENVKVLTPDPTPDRLRTQRHNKLVRTRVPNIIDRRGERANAVTVSGPVELLVLLKDKLVEEAREVRGATRREDLRAELADLLEVIRALAGTVELTMTDIERVADSKREERGGFTEGVLLVDTSSTTGVTARADPEDLPLELAPAGRRRRESRDSGRPWMRKRSHGGYRITAPVSPTLGVEARQWDLGVIDDDGRRAWVEYRDGQIVMNVGPQRPESQLSLLEKQGADET
jgi:predicted house-cleaning noncanonical NTP pyrophosphatase (MazG superfamily)